MKRLIFRIAVMLVMFASGLGVDRLVRRLKSNNAPPPQVESVSVEREVPVTVTPVAPKATPAATPKPNLILDYDSEKFNPYAYFSIMGPIPDDFLSFGGIELGLVNDADDPGYITVGSYDSNNNYDTASATFALVTERRLFFVTSPARFSGVEYRFDGEFLRTDFNSVAGKDKKVLRGTVTKTRNGIKIAEHTFNFSMYHLGC